MIMFREDRYVERLAPLVAAAIPAVSGIISSLFGHSGQSAANSANAQQAELNRDFQERMRNTEMQARVKDLKAAGLNPAMAMTSGLGASSMPGSVSAPQQNTASSAVSMAPLLADVALKAGQLRNVDADTAGKAILNATNSALLGPAMAASTAAANALAFKHGQEGFLTSENRAWLDRLNASALARVQSEIQRNSAGSAADVSRSALDRARLPEMKLRGRVAGDINKGITTSAEGWNRIFRLFSPDED